MTALTTFPALTAPRSTELMSSLKINARVGESAAAQLADLTRKTGLGVSEIVRLSLAHYHESVFQTQKPKPKSRIVEMAGKYGSTGPDAGTLSTRYKELFAQGIAEKYSLGTRNTDVQGKPKQRKAPKAETSR